MALVENQTVTSVIDTNSDSLAQLTVPKKYGLYLHLNTKGMEINDTKDIALPGQFTLHLTKSDYGLYSGYVTKKIADTGSEFPVRFQKKTLNEILKALQVKEIIGDYDNEVIIPKPEINSDNISIPADKGNINITINIQKSLNKGDLAVKNRKSISKDLIKALQETGLNAEEVMSKSSSIKEMVGYLPKEKQGKFLSRLHSYSKFRKSFDKIADELDIPEELKTEEDLFKAKEAFRKCIKVLSKNKSLDKASKTTVSFFKSKFGNSGIKKIRKALKEARKQKIQKSEALKATIGELISEDFRFIEMKKSEYDKEIEPIAKGFVDKPIDEWNSVKKRN